MLLGACALASAEPTAELSVEESPETPLADAAENEDWEVVTDLLEAEADVEAQQADGMTALHWASHSGSLAAVRTLLAAGANPNTKTRYGVTPLSLACVRGDADVVLALLSASANANTKLAGGESVLMLAARTGQLDSVRMLLAAGAKIDAAENSGQTALMWAAAEGHVEVVDVLLKMGADPVRTSHRGFSAYLFAAREGRISVVQRMLAEGVDVDTKIYPKSTSGRNPRKGMPALLLAVESGHFELAAYLVEQGANPNDQQSRFTPLHAVSWVRKASRGDNPAGDPEPTGSGKLTSLQFVRRAVELGANVNARLERGKSGRAVLNVEGATPFLMAAKTADVPLMRLLLELGADPHITNVDGSTALMAAAGVGVLAVGEEPGTEPEVLAAIDLLIDLGIDVNAKDANGETAMHGAAYRNYPLAVERLAASGADPKIWDAKNKWNATPVMVAEGKRPGSLKPSPETIAALKRAMD